MLGRKILLLTDGESWGDTIPLFDGYLDPINVDNGLGPLYGGIDFKDNTRRLRDLNGFMLAVQERMSYDVACEAITLDFTKSEDERLFFNNISLDSTPNNQFDAIKKTISRMIWMLWGTKK